MRFRDILRRFEKYDIPYDYVISNNGAIIFDAGGNKIYEQAISIDVSSKIICTCRYCFYKSWKREIDKAVIRKIRYTK